MGISHKCLVELPAISIKEVIAVDVVELLQLLLTERIHLDGVKVDSTSSVLHPTTRIHVNNSHDFMDQLQILEE